MTAIRRTALLACVITLGIAGARPAAAQSAAAQSSADSADARAIRAQRERSNAAIARHDTAGVAAIFAPHVAVLTSNSVSMVGRDVNAERFADQFRTRPDVVYRRTPSEVKVFAQWRMASELGAYVLKIDAPLESRELKEIVSAFRPSSSVEGRRSMIG